MATHQLTCFSSPADGIRSGSVVLQTGGEKGPKVRLIRCALVCSPYPVCLNLLKYGTIFCRGAASHLESANTLIALIFLHGLQYLFNAPEGFARLVLEHKVRPSQNLRAAFVTQLSPHTTVATPFLHLLIRGLWSDMASTTI